MNVISRFKGIINNTVVSNEEIYEWVLDFKEYAEDNNFDINENLLLEIYENILTYIAAHDDTTSNSLWHSSIIETERLGIMQLHHSKYKNHFDSINEKLQDYLR